MYDKEMPIEVAEDFITKEWSGQSKQERDALLSELGYDPEPLDAGDDWKALPVEVREAILEDFEGAGR